MAAPVAPATPIAGNGSGVTPVRTEPFLPRRRPDHPEDQALNAPILSTVGPVVGSTAVAAEPAPAPHIERDPSVNKSLLLRLIAGVRGL
jgi:hypothetical protein